MDNNDHPCSCQLCQPTITVEADSADVRVRIEDMDEVRLDRFFQERRRREAERRQAHSAATLSRN